MIDVLDEQAAGTSVKKSTTLHMDIDKTDGNPLNTQVDHIAKSKLELTTKAQNLQKSLKLIIFQVEQGKKHGVGMTEIEEREGSETCLTCLSHYELTTKTRLVSIFTLHPNFSGI